MRRRYYAGRCTACGWLVPIADGMCCACRERARDNSVVRRAQRAAYARRVRAEAAAWRALEKAS